MIVRVRQVSPQRRVGLPKGLAEHAGIQPENWVTVRPAVGARWALDVRPSHGPLGEVSVRDPDRPRRVTRVLQVTVPKRWMEFVELAPREWVYLTTIGPGQGLRMTPQSKATLQLEEVRDAR